MRITITIDVDGQGQVSINAGHETAANNTEKQQPGAQSASAEEPKPKKEPESKMDPEPKAKPAPAEEPASAPAEEPESDNDGGVTLDDIRDAAKLKINTHRDEIKAKLTELGASKIADLSPEYYEDFYVFLSCELK